MTRLLLLLLLLLMLMLMLCIFGPRRVCQLFSCILYFDGTAVFRVCDVCGLEIV